MKLTVSVITCVFLSFATTAPAQSGAAPKTVLLNPAAVAAAKAHPAPGLMSQMIKEADEAMKTPPLSVTSKTKVPPSGDKHDYVSLARYFWPNPDTKDHLPYVRHDGKTNPEIYDIHDLADLERTTRSARALAVGWYFTGDKRYAEHAALLLRNWFLNPDTRMNPNANFAQYIPGVNDGRGAGILDLRRSTYAIDAAGLLAGSSYWTAADETGLKQWFSDYYDWLHTSAGAKTETVAPNNHGSWFQMQDAAVASYLGKPEDVRATAERVLEKRIPSQFDEKGLQKYEMVRTNSFSYSAFNLEALTQLAIIAGPVGVDLYTPAKPGDPGILSGLDALLPYDKDHPWPGQQINPELRDAICPALARAVGHTHDAKYLDAQKRFGCQTSVQAMIDAMGSGTPAPQR